MAFKISTFTKDITPQVGVLLAGYGPDVVSKGIHDHLFIKGIALDDDENRILLLSFDLIGMDRDFIVAIRKACSAVAKIPEKNVILTCTHTHSAPHTRRLANLNLTGQRLKDFEKYKAFLVESSANAVLDCFSGISEVDVFHYSTQCHENINRRLIGPDNNCTYIPENKHLIPLANNITDAELGMVYFVNRKSNELLATIVNYAAHPLTCQSEGLSSHLISADYPGVLRCEIEAQLGGNCIFISGACGDLHPVGFESGFSRTKEMGMSIAQKVINCYSDAIWNPEKYKLPFVDLSITSTTVELPFRQDGCTEERLPFYEGKDIAEAELQILAIGEIVLVGVPGELLCGPGLEIKWHSPFRKTFILYNSTAYLSYLPPANCFQQGGYEAETCHLTSMATFTVISETIKTMHKLKEK